MIKPVITILYADTDDASLAAVFFNEDLIYGGDATIVSTIAANSGSHLGTDPIETIIDNKDDLIDIDWHELGEKYLNY